MILPVCRLLLLAIAALPLAACNKPKIEVYTAPKDGLATPAPNESAAAPASAAATPAPGAPVPVSQFKWTVPADWKETKPGPMQQARFTVPEKDGAQAEVAVSVFPSDTGGTLANVNRWRAQLGLPPVEESGLAHLVAPLSAAPGAQLVDLANNDKRMLTAIVPRDGIWWFYKMTGGAAAVANARDAFIGFVSSRP
jgi:hypothetical protein